MITRVLVAHDAGARVFENRGPGKGLVELQAVDFEDGRRHNGEIDSDKPGRSFSRSGQSSHAYEPHQGAKAHAVEFFAKELAHDLAHAFDEHAFHQLVLIAPPRFLGTLRDSLATKVSKAVIGSVAKDLPRATSDELRAYLEPYVTC